MCEIGWIRHDAPLWVHDTAEFLSCLIEQFRVASWRDRLELIIWLPLIALAAMFGGLGGLVIGLFKRAKPWLYEEPHGGGTDAV